MSKWRKWVLAIGGAAAIALPTVGAASPEFLVYEGRNAVHDGQGGERKTVDGVDFWMRGDPPRRYQVLGSLSDRRHKTGLYGAIRMSGLESDLAKAAKAAGGDAIILEGEQDEVTGVTGSTFGNVNGTYGGGYYSGNGSAFGISREIKDHESRYLVVRYLPDPPPAAAPAAAGGQGAPPTVNGQTAPLP
ncbi:hypothetical protein ACO2Q3_22575 [Caulobacter sp. KR2-114]|uniref:hypothetical protein n=1 Tax=Caulobacter sp. KR2-114 TaxID=3400912 RepID=UPI003C00FFCF